MLYAAYGPRTTEAEARAAFAKRYGCEPLRVWRHNVVLAGPKPEGGRDEIARLDFESKQVADTHDLGASQGACNV